MFRGVGIELTKRIPVQARSRRWQLRCGDRARRAESDLAVGLTVDELARIGLTLGADVPFFVRGPAAWAEGVGEQLTPYDFPRAISWSSNRRPR